MSHQLYFDLRSRPPGTSIRALRGSQIEDRGLTLPDCPSGSSIIGLVPDLAEYRPGLCCRSHWSCLRLFVSAAVEGVVPAVGLGCLLRADLLALRMSPSLNGHSKITSPLSRKACQTGSLLIGARYLPASCISLMKPISASAVAMSRLRSAMADWRAAATASSRCT